LCVIITIIQIKKRIIQHQSPRLAFSVYSDDE